ncbi:zinc finger protein 271-like isoform X2 [Limulus polyphemus]|uniref:Zinc finger protein 271-like isoform X2 n=1 Tax=Limulus polyphemus TaxID=6850 RepID=A0ABM1TL72_LIMPO|nr:zinc finger protein 271-like isoform X2 [Limulus polyphemus]
MATDSVPVETVLTEEDGEFNIPAESPVNMQEKQFSGSNNSTLSESDFSPLDVTLRRNIAHCSIANVPRSISSSENDKWSSDGKHPHLISSEDYTEELKRNKTQNYLLLSGPQDKLYGRIHSQLTYKEQERIRQRSMMQLKRQDPFFRAVEREKQRTRMKTRRQDPLFRNIERERQRIRMKMKRQDPIFRQKERERQKYRMQLKRQDPVFKEQEKARGRSRSQMKRKCSQIMTEYQNKHRKVFEPYIQFCEPVTREESVKHLQQQALKEKSNYTVSSKEKTQPTCGNESLMSTSNGSCDMQPTSQPQNKNDTSDIMAFGYYRPNVSHCTSASSLSCLLRTTGDVKTLSDISTIALHSSVAINSEALRGDHHSHQGAIPNVVSVMNPLLQSYMSAASGFVKGNQLPQQKTSPARLPCSPHFIHNKDRTENQGIGARENLQHHFKSPEYLNQTSPGLASRYINEQNSPVATCPINALPDPNNTCRNVSTNSGQRKPSFSSPRTSNGGPFSCLECGAQLQTLSGYRYHQQGHSGDIVYKCDMCGKAYSNRGSYFRHMKHHTESFECQICNKVFHMKQHLKEHMKSHGDKNLCCPHCDYKTCYKYALNRHIAIRHTFSGNEPCPSCGVILKSYRQLVRHQEACRSLSLKAVPCTAVAATV